MIKWAEISFEPDQKRFGVLANFLSQAGLENSVDFITSEEHEFPEVISRLQGEYHQLRIGGELALHTPDVGPQKPAEILQTRFADALLAHEGEPRPIWPKCCLAEGFRRAMVSDVKTIDQSASVFIYGGTCEARAAVNALSRMGFRKFTIADSNDLRGQMLVDNFRESYFGSQFVFVPRHHVTQLPAVHSVAVNTLIGGVIDGALRELFFFNFLKPGGVWSDLAYHSPSSELETEAKTAGAVILPGYRVAAWTDVYWAELAFGLRLSVDSLSAAYREVFDSY